MLTEKYEQRASTCPSKGPRVAILINGSTDDEVEAQLRRLEGEAKRLNGAVVGEYGGRDAFGDLERLHSDVATGRCDLVLVCDLGRIGKDEAILECLGICDHHGVAVHVPEIGRITRFHVFALALASRLKGHTVYA